MKSKSIVSVACCFVGAAALLPASYGCSSASPNSGFTDGTTDRGSSSSGGSSGQGSSGSSGGGGSSGLIGGGDGGTSSGGIGPECAKATASTSKRPVYMMIGLDGSGSMAFDPVDGGRGPDNQKWKSVVPALDAIFDDLKSKADPAFAVGLFVFSDQRDPFGTGPYPNYGAPPFGAGDVAIANVDQSQDSKLHGRIDSTSPNGGTPSGAAMMGAYDALDKYTPAAPVPPNGKKVFVFMTDGVPSDGTTTATAAGYASSALSKGTLTFVVGIGNFPTSDKAVYDPAFLGHVAMAGGTGPAGCNQDENSDVAKVCHFQVTPGSKPVAQLEQEFIDAINKIRDMVASCEYTLDKSGGSIDPSLVNVQYTDGSGKTTDLVKDPKDGWTYDNDSNPSQVILHGTSCDAVKNTANATVKIIIGCKTVTR